MADQKLQGTVDGVFYAPVDAVFAVRSVLRTLRPAVVLVAETEIWPNLFREVKRTKAALAIVNGRISNRAFPRYQPWKWFFEAVLAAPDAILTQTEEDRRRYVALGAPAERVRVAGNLKFDFEPKPPDPTSPVAAWAQRTRPARDLDRRQHHASSRHDRRR